MRGDFNRDRDELEHAIRHGLGLFLHQCEGPPPALTGVTVEYEDRHRRDVIHCVFAPDQHFIITLRDRGECLDGRWADLACELTRQIYNRLFEDHMVNLETGAMRRALVEGMRLGLPPEQLDNLRRTIAEHEQHARQFHHGRQQMDALALRLWSLEGALRHVTGITPELLGSIDVGSAKAQEKGLLLLKANLTPVQLKQYEKRQYFEVIGCDTRKRYRINHGRQMNIDELDKRGKRVCGWCFLPEGALVAGDVMLAQKIALETNEKAVLKIANKIGSNRLDYRGPF